MFYVYLIRCRNGRYYAGATGNWVARWNEHVAGRGCNFTRRNKPVFGAVVKSFKTFENALKCERKIKKMGHDQKSALLSIYGSMRRENPFEGV